MKDLKILATMMGERTGEVTEEDRALEKQIPMPATQPPPPPLSAPLPWPKRNWTGPQTPAKQPRDPSPAPTLMHSDYADAQTDPTQPPPAISATAAGSALRYGDRKRDGRRLRGSATGKERREGQD